MREGRVACSCARPPLSAWLLSGGFSDDVKTKVEKLLGLSSLDVADAVR